MEKLHWILLVVASAFLIFNLASAFSCYSCNSHFHTDCGFNDGPLNKSHIRECDVNATLCRKIHQWVDFKENGLGPDERLIRECGFNQTRDRPYYYRQGLGGRVEVLTCYFSDCNAADYPSFSGFVIICVTVASLVINTFN